MHCGLWPTVKIISNIYIYINIYIYVYSLQLFTIVYIFFADLEEPAAQGCLESSKWLTPNKIQSISAHAT